MGNNDNEFSAKDLKEYITMRNTNSSDEVVAKIKYTPLNIKHKCFGHTKRMNGDNEIECKNVSILVITKSCFFLQVLESNGNIYILYIKIST